MGAELYLIEYTLQKPGEDKVHLMSAVGVHFNGIYNQLYTLTAQVGSSCVQPSEHWQHAHPLLVVVIARWELPVHVAGQRTDEGTAAEQGHPLCCPVLLQYMEEDASIYEKTVRAVSMHVARDSTCCSESRRSVAS